MDNAFQVPFFDLVLCISNALDLVSPAVVDHHKQVAHIASDLAKELGLPQEDRREIILAAAIHDAGALSLKDRLDILRFEQTSPWRHSDAGYKLLRAFGPLVRAANIVRYHHVPWRDGRGAGYMEKSVPMESHIIHLADRAAVLINKRRNILGQAGRITRVIESQSGNMFVPEHVEAFKSLASRESFWFDTFFGNLEQTIADETALWSARLDLEGFVEFGKMFSQIIDFRSRFTAAHSRGVAACAEALAGFLGFSPGDCTLMLAAGYLHDLGKLAVPSEMIEKPSSLYRNEFNVMKSHTFYTYRILEPVSELHLINTWASYHHERLDGKGYPFHLSGKGLSEGSRAMAVADVFTAITEDRPYRKGMKREDAVKTMNKMVENGKLDGNIVGALVENYDALDGRRSQVQDSAREHYVSFTGLPHKSP